MDGLWSELNNHALQFFNNPSVMETLVDILVSVVPIWVAVMIGLLIGWSWRPRWTGLLFLGFRSKLRFIWTAPPGFGARRFWFAFTAAFSAFSVCRRIWFTFGCRNGKTEFSGEAAESDVEPITGASDVEQNNVSEKDLEHLLHFLDGKDVELTWQSMMERSTSNMTYQAWRHEPEVTGFGRGNSLFARNAMERLRTYAAVLNPKPAMAGECLIHMVGPVIYHSKTIFEDATPELVRDFFWDDEFRPKWDPMLAYFKILEESHDTGMMIVHWIKKFPFFCSDREYIIGRRIWEAGKTYYCLTKGVPYTTLARRDKPRRVDLYFSSWVIRPVQSRKGDGQLSACEVALVHYEDMGIPKDVAKLGVRHGMWGTVKKLHSGFRAYQAARKLESTSLSRCALMARITTKFPFMDGTELGENVSGEEEENNRIVVAEKRNDGIDWKWLAVGGTVALVCGIQTGFIGKVLLIGAGHRVARRR